MNRITLMKRADNVLGRFLAKVLPGARPRPVRDFRSILIIRPGGIGDAVLLMPTIQALQSFDAGVQIDVLAEKRNVKVYDLVPGLRSVFAYDRPAEMLSVLKSRYDVVIDTEQWHRLSAVFARMIRAGVRIGYAPNERGRLFSHPVAYRHEIYEAESFLDLLTPLIGKVSHSYARKFLTVPQVAREKATGLLGTVDKPFVAIFPGASIPERRWGASRFHAVAQSLAQRSVPVVVVGGTEDRAAGDQIVAGLSGLNLAGKTSLVETAAVIERAAVLVSGDSGVLHIGVGLDRPTVSLFGSGIAAKWAPKGAGHVVLNKGLPCSPCTRFGTTPPCPIDTRCLKDISVDEVVQAIWTLLDNHAGSEV